MDSLSLLKSTITSKKSRPSDKEGLLRWSIRLECGIFLSYWEDDPEGPQEQTDLIRSLQVDEEVWLKFKHIYASEGKSNTFISVSRGWRIARPKNKEKV